MRKTCNIRSLEKHFPIFYLVRLSLSKERGSCVTFSLLKSMPILVHHWTSQSNYKFTFFQLAVDCQLFAESTLIQFVTEFQFDMYISSGIIPLNFFFSSSLILRSKGTFIRALSLFYETPESTRCPADVLSYL